MEDISRLKFIGCMRSADVPIESLKTYIDLYDQNEDTFDERLSILRKEYNNMLEKKDIEEGIACLDMKIELLEQGKLDRKLRGI